MTFENRRYLIIPATLIDQVDFNQVLQTSAETCRYSVDGSKTFIKYNITILDQDQHYTYTDIETNEEVTSTTPAGVYGRPSIYDESMTEYTHDEILQILDTPEWTPANEDGIVE